ncbi:MAG TPA: ABC transporter ATP-binding protein [Candidatus Thermoplasmatota archaeon]|nr:ABC transporter ATP-binding protein [Candidatus Thermoplasmatota archaeon]
MADSNVPAIEMRGVVKRYGDVIALDGLTCAIPRGQVYGLLGPNGSGKTTAIRLLVGLERAQEGSVRALGIEAPDRALNTRIGYMPQETALYQDLTVRENLELFGELHGMERGRMDARMRELLQLVDLTPRADSVVHTLSGGMRHRTSLVAALLHDPELLILDEPTVGVDPELRANFWGYFDDLAARGVTVLITTHYMDEARHCDRIGLLRRGKLIAEGTPRDVMDEAQTDDLETAFLRLAGRRQPGGASA